MSNKHYKILIPKSVEIALANQMSYMIKEQHIVSIAYIWFDGIMDAINSLTEFPNRCPIAPENSSFKKNSEMIIRHFIYKKSFRIIFTIVKNQVRILSVKHGARLA